MEGLEIDVIHPRDTVVAVIEAATTGTAGGTTARTEEAEGTINRNPKGHEESKTFVFLFHLFVVL